MGKKINFLIVLFIILFISVSNIYIYFNKANVSISGFSVSDFSDKVGKLDISTIFFLIQWVLILLVVISFYVKFLKRRKEKKPMNITIRREKGAGKTHTDLDDLYDLLKERKHIRISDIAKAFKISTEKASEWCKILEEHGLSYMDYPTLSEPELIVKEE